MPVTEMPKKPTSMTMYPRTIMGAGLLGAGLCSALLLGGCGGIGGVDGVDLQGGAFDALGISSSTPKKEKEPKVAARPGLVLPPSETALPPPGEKTARAGAQADSWPLDPEENKSRASAALDQRHKEYCEREMRNARLNNQTGVIVGPKGNCQPGLFGSLTGLFQGERQ